MCTRTGGGRAGDLQSKDPLPTLRSSARSILHAEVVNIYFIDEATDTLWCCKRWAIPLLKWDRNILLSETFTRTEASPSNGGCSKSCSMQH